MQTRFIHAADIHLGYEQYNLIPRANDFARAYLAVVEHAVRERVDFVLIAGDLFHRASADAWMLKQATEGLALLRRAGIPVIAVEGNHDAQHARKQLSWLEYLCDQELLILLNVHTANGFRSLQPWDPEERRGSWIDISGARIYGLKYYGAATARLLEEIQSDLEPGPGGYTILMLHAGVEGQVPHLHGGLTMGQLAALHPPVDYLALGHVHKRLEEGWILNPGSTETNSMEEIEWPHGFFDVFVDTGLPEKHTVSYVDTPGLRPFRRLVVLADGVSGATEFAALAEERIAAATDIPSGAIVEVVLAGTAQFTRQDVPLEQIKSAVEARHEPLAVRVRNSLVPPGTVSVRHGEHLRRAELERQIVEHLIYQLGDYRDRASAWTRLTLEVKAMAAEGAPADSIAEHVRQGMLRLHEGGTEDEVAEETEPERTPVPATPTERSLQDTGEPTTVGPGPGALRASWPPRRPGRPRPDDDQAAGHPSDAQAEIEEPTGGEPPCLAPMFEDW